MHVKNMLKEFIGVSDLSPADQSLVLDITQHGVSEAQLAAIRVAKSAPPHLYELVLLTIIAGIGLMSAETLRKEKEKL